MGYLSNDFFNIVWNGKTDFPVPKLLPFLFDNSYFVLNRNRVMGSYLRAEPVFEGGDYSPTIGIVFRVGAGNKHDIQGQPNSIALYLDICLFHQVEQTNL